MDFNINMKPLVLSLR